MSKRGLRSYDRGMPEEVNRIVTDALADLLLTPSEDGNENLVKEGISKARIKFVGNVMIDALIANLEQAPRRELPTKLGLKEGTFVYVTLQRPSNVDDEASLKTIMWELEQIGKEWPVVFPMRPRTRKMCGQFGIAPEDIAEVHILEPIGCHDSLCLTEMARFILTDSGGLQEESTYFRTPCLTLRPNTERPITVTVGSNKLTSLENSSNDIADVMRRQDTPGRIPPMWDGKTSQRIIYNLLNAHSKV